MRPRNEGSTGKSSFGYSDGTLGVEKGPPGKPRAEESRVENAAGRRPTCPANNQILKAEAGSSGGSSRASAVFQHPTLLNHRGGGADYPTSVSRYSRWRLRTSR